jgi:hypothetical protein
MSLPKETRKLANCNRIRYDQEMFSLKYFDLHRVIHLQLLVLSLPNL